MDDPVIASKPEAGAGTFLSHESTYRKAASRESGLVDLILKRKKINLQPVCPLLKINSFMENNFKFYLINFVAARCSYLEEASLPY